MKKRTKILLIVFAALILLAAALCWWQWDNLTALKISLDYSREDLSQMMDQNDQRVGAVSDALDGVTVRDLTDEEKAALQDGTMAPEELIDRLVDSQAGLEQDVSEPASTATPSPSPESTPQQGQTAEPTPTPGPVQSPAPAPESSPAPTQSSEQEKRDQLARYIAEIYLMKSEYTAWLEATHQAAIDEFVALPEEQQTTAKKYEIGMRYMRLGLDKEDECDLKMKELEGKILVLLQELGEDTSLVNEIQAAYEEEKALKKAYYLGLHD